MTDLATGFEFTVEGTARGSLGVTGFHVREQLSDGFHASVEAVSARAPRSTASPVARSPSSST